MNHVALFARRPESGSVKTRLSPALPPRLVCDLYRGMLGDALEAVAASRADRRRVLWLGTEAGEPVAVPASLTEGEQSGSDLGERLERAFAAILGEPGRAVVIGADCPLLDAAYIDRAFATLERADLVLGPARDGGYTLIGLAREARGLFRGVAWGTPGVLDQTLERAGRAGLTIEKLPMLEDLDTPADLVRALVALIERPRAAPHTRQALQAMGLLPAA
ncbi:MAG: TIGR04282 family arsenosugar biosynthesis glycosyltransferase [Candidatus Eisenbacteria bacterium]|nr:TIGR04282 family arsenosugar biosynthesis glycosyltransferase [Candidatus Eisenbacteria bacterium]